MRVRLPDGSRSHQPTRKSHPTFSTPKALPSYGAQGYWATVGRNIGPQLVGILGHSWQGYWATAGRDTCCNGHSWTCLRTPLPAFGVDMSHDFQLTSS